DADGWVTAHGTGVTSVLVHTLDGGKFAACTVTVEGAAVPVTGVRLNYDGYSLTVGGSGVLTATVIPAHATDAGLRWSSSDPSVVSVRDNGQMAGLRACAATVTVTTADGGFSASCRVTVRNSGGAASVRLDRNTLTLTTDHTYTLTAVVLPEDAVNRRVSWSSSDPAVADVSQSGQVTARQAGTATVTVTTEDGGWKDTCLVTVTQSAGELRYSVRAGEAVALEAADFHAVSREVSGRALERVRFHTVSGGLGRLVCGYDGGSYREVASTSADYFLAGRAPLLNELSFLAGGSEGEWTLAYTGYDVGGGSFTGTLTFVVTPSPQEGVILYQGEQNGAVLFAAEDFNALCLDLTGYALDYVRFSFPVSAANGRYFAGNSAAVSSVSYRRTGTPGINQLRFVPQAGWLGTTSVAFTGRNLRGGDFSGRVEFTVVDPVAESEIICHGSAGEAVAFFASDFNAFCREKTGEDLGHVTFTLPPATQGVLYLSYGTTAVKRLAASTRCYLSGTNALGELSFVPTAGADGRSVHIPFTGISSGGRSFSGTVRVEWTAAQEPNDVSYETSGAAVTLRAADFTAASGAELSTVIFQLPERSVGTLFQNYGGPTAVNTAVPVGRVFGTLSPPLIDTVTFVPRAGFEGTAVIPYTGTDRSGATRSGRVRIRVDLPEQSVHFVDMGSRPDAAAAVEFLYDNAITLGVGDGRYDPAGQMIRGDFILMLSRAFHFPTLGSDSGFSDVDPSLYFAAAITSARSVGVALGSDDGRFLPFGTLTREDALVLLDRTLTRMGRPLPAAGETQLLAFADRADISSYARTTIASMTQAGVVVPDENGLLSPRQPLTRADMALFLHRLLTQ
ncbi:MAG: Ig-like domain-containing protein, partial [Clostridia bacterium]|nr:Ig-like domain-containing protein [Clostridia bacterium]